MQNLISNNNEKNILLNIAFLFFGFSIVLFDNYKYLSLFYLSILMIGFLFIYMLATKRIKLQSNSFIKLYTFFVILCLASSFLSDDFTYSSRRALNIFFIFLNIFFIYNLNQKYQNYIYIIYGIYIAIFVNFLWLVGIVNIGLKYEGWRFQGSVLQANDFVFILTFTMISLLFLLIQNNNLTKRIIFSIMFLIAIYLIVMTGSKAGLLSIFLISITLLINILNPKSLFKFILSLITFVIILTNIPLFDYIKNNSSLNIEYTITNVENRLNQFMNTTSNNTDTSTRNRLIMLNDAYEMWNEQLIFGNGIAAFEIKYGHYSHNNILELLVSFGLLGFFIYYSIYYIIFKNIGKIASTKLKLSFYLFGLMYILFDQSIVSYTGKFKVLSLLLLFLMIEQIIKKKKETTNEKN